MHRVMHRRRVRDGDVRVEHHLLTLPFDELSFEVPLEVCAAQQRDVWQ
jgi:hypothetical protein